MSAAETNPPIDVPDRVNMATWFLDARLDEGRGEQVAVYYEGKDARETWTYAALVEASRRITNLLRAHDLRSALRRRQALASGLGRRWRRA